MMVEADIHLRLLSKSKRDISKVICNMFELLVCCLTDIWEHPHTTIQAKLAPDYGLLGHLCRAIATATAAATVGGPVLKLSKKKIAPNAIFRVVSCLYILYDLTCSIWLKKSTHSHSYKADHCFTMFFTSD
jgi:hypothetical protein